MLNNQLPTMLERSIDSRSPILKRIVFLALILQIFLGYSQKALAQSGSALQFDGADDYVAINNPFTAFQRVLAVIILVLSGHGSVTNITLIVSE